MTGMNPGGGRASEFSPPIARSSTLNIVSLSPPQSAEHGEVELDAIHGRTHDAPPHREYYAPR